MQNFHISIVLFILHFGFVYSEYVVVIWILDGGPQVY